MYIGATIYSDFDQKEGGSLPERRQIAV